MGFVLPIHRKWKPQFSLTGLAFGCLAPDYDILFRLTKVRFHLFQYDLKTIAFVIFPLALVSAFAFHLFCRNILIEHLPLYYERKYEPFKCYNFFQDFKKHYIRISLSALLAIFLHLLLDLLCHGIDAYKAELFLSRFTGNHLVHAIAYLFTIYGLPVAFSFVGFYLIYTSEIRKPFSIKDFSIPASKRMFWMAMFLLTVLTWILKFYISTPDPPFFFDAIVITFTSSLLIGVYATCFIYFITRKIKAA